MWIFEKQSEIRVKNFMNSFIRRSLKDDTFEVDFAEQLLKRRRPKAFKHPWRQQLQQRRLLP